MKVLILTASMGIGGRERQLYELLRGLANRIEFKLIVLDNTISWDVAALGIDCICMDKSKRMKPKALFHMLKTIRKYNPDIVHYWDYPSKMLALLVKLTTHCKLIDCSIRFVAEAPANFFVKQLKKLSFTFADHIVANSMEGLKKKPYLDKKNTSVIYNGMDIQRFKNNRTEELDLKGISSEDIKVVMVAGFQPAKDYYTLIKAANVLCPRYGNLIFLLVGDGILRAECEAALDPDIRDRVQFLGRRTDVEEILLQCDIGVLLSSDTEGLSNSIMEYMAAGLPVVATRKGGTTELVDDGVSGYLIDNFNMKQLVDNLEKLILDPMLRKSIGGNGARRINDKFSYQKMLDAYLCLYDQLLSTSKKHIGVV